VKAANTPERANRANLANLAVLDPKRTVIWLFRRRLEGMANRHLDRVLRTDYLDGINEWPIEEIRERRAECQRLEDAASYLRRLVQTRIDILGMEARSRSDGQLPDLDSLIRHLPTILSDGDRRSMGGRLLSADLEDNQELWAEARVAEACGNHDVESATELDDDVLAVMADNLAGLEREVSAERRRLHDIFDSLQAELVRRYRSGLASVDGLLT
jgi:hypothetical protein